MKRDETFADVHHREPRRAPRSVSRRRIPIRRCRLSRVRARHPHELVLRGVVNHHLRADPPPIHARTHVRRRERHVSRLARVPLGIIHHQSVARDRSSRASQRDAHQRERELGQRSRAPSSARDRRSRRAHRDVRARVVVVAFARASSSSRPRARRRRRVRARVVASSSRRRRRRARE